MHPSSTSLILYDDARHVHLGLSSTCVPTAAVPTTSLPLTPPLTFATRLSHIAITHLRLGRRDLRTHSLVIVMPPIQFGDAQRASIVHAAQAILKLRSVRFVSSHTCAIAALGLNHSRPPLLVHVFPRACIIESDTRTHVVPIGSHAVDSEIAAKCSTAIDSDRAARYRMACGVCPAGVQYVGRVELGDVKDGAIGDERAQAWDVLFGRGDGVDEGEWSWNMAEQVLSFVLDIRDVYQRASVARSVVVVGEGATAPGFGERLVAEINEVAVAKGVVRRDGAFSKLIESTFSANIVLWTGAAVLVEGKADMDRADTDMDSIG